MNEAVAHQQAPAQFPKINDSGLRRIAQALTRYHKDGPENVTTMLVMAYAVEVEANYHTRKTCEFEICGEDTVNGVPVLVPLGTDDYDFFPNAVDVF